MKNNYLLILIFTSIFSFGQTINELGYYNKNGVFSLTSKDDYIFLGSGEIINNTIPSAPVLVSQYSFNGLGTTVLVEGNYAYFGIGMTSAIYVANVSNLNFPLHSSKIEINLGGGVFGMDISKNTLFVALGNEGTICSIDITNKSNLVMLDTLKIPGGQCRDIVLRNDYAFAAHEGGLKIIDVSNPSNLKVISSIESGYNSIDMNDNLVFLGKSSGGIDVFDVSDIENPSLAFSIPNSGGTAWDIKYFDDHLYLATNSNGLFVYKLESNKGVEKANYLNTGNGQSFGVAIQGDHVLLSGLINGVAILKYNELGIVNAVNNEWNSQQFEVFPNPTSGLIQLSIESNWEVFSTIGVKLFEGQGDKIDLSTLSTGMYLIRTEGKTITIVKE